MNNSILQRTANYLQRLGSDVRFFLILCGENIRFSGSTGSIFPCLGGKGKWGMTSHGSRTCHGSFKGRKQPHFPDLHFCNPTFLVAGKEGLCCTQEQEDGQYLPKQQHPIAGLGFTSQTIVWWWEMTELM